jgi:hypothetical protein
MLRSLIYTVFVREAFSVVYSGRRKVMKKSSFVLICSLFLLLSVLAQAQETEKEDFFAKTVLITKIYSHALGFKIVYHKVSLGLGVIYVPFSWFSQVNSPGDLITGDDSSYPYFTVFYRNGKFDHIEVFVQRSREHISWGLLNITRDQAEKLFAADINTFKVEY